MTPEELARVAEFLRQEADTLWRRMQEVSKLPVIHPPDVIELVAMTTGKLQGLAAAIEWHAKHTGGK